jgi:hypothetical protein
MKLDSVAVVAIIVAVGEALNFFLFLRIRVSQLESEKRVLDEVDLKYVRKDSAAVAVRVQPEHG